MTKEVGFTGHRQKSFTLHQSKGFTLVELAIVMTIIGLLIGGILKGQQMLQNSRVTATVAQIKAIEAATTSFRDAYGALPGDLKNASTKIPACSAAACSATAGRGDGSIGNPSWGMIMNNLPTAGGNDTTVNSEIVLFWYELLKAGLISGVTGDGLNATPNYAFGKGLPGMKVGGGFWIGNNDGTCFASEDETSPMTASTGCSANGRPSGLGQYTLLGTVLVTVDLPNPNPGKGGIPITTNTLALTPTTAATLDRKIDEGDPSVGAVQAFGVSGSCYQPLGSGYIYNENITSKDCGVYIRIQN